MAQQTKSTNTELHVTHIRESNYKSSVRDDGLEILCEEIVKLAVSDWQMFFQGNDVQYATDPSSHEGISRRELIKFFNGELINDYLAPFPSLSAGIIRKALGIPTVELQEFEKEEEFDYGRKRNPYYNSRGR